MQILLWLIDDKWRMESWQVEVVTQALRFEVGKYPMAEGYRRLLATISTEDFTTRLAPLRDWRYFAALHLLSGSQGKIKIPGEAESVSCGAESDSVHFSWRSR